MSNIIIAIYKITSPSGKVYIGQSKNYNKRLKNYKNLESKYQVKLHNSFLFYGVESHKFEIVYQFPNDISQDIVNNYEILYWQQYKDCGVEMLNTREPGTQGKISLESREKMSKSRKGIKHSPEWTEKIRQSNIGQKRSKEGIENMIKSRPRSSSHYRSCKVIDVITKQTWDSISDCVNDKEYKGINYKCKRSLSGALKGEFKNKTNIRIL